MKIGGCRIPAGVQPSTPPSKTSGVAIFALLTLGIVTIAAHAQYMGAFGVPYNNPVSASLSSSVWSNWVVYETQRRKAGGAPLSGSSKSPENQLGPAAATSASGPSSSSGAGHGTSTQGKSPHGKSTQGKGAEPARVPVKVDEASLTFKQTGTRLLTPKLVDQLGKTQAEKDQVAAILTMLFQEFDKQAAKLGRPNDLAFALSYFMAQNATLYRGRPDPKDQQFLDLRETVVLALGQSGAFARMTDRQKQEMYEMLVAYTGLVYLTYQDAKRRGDTRTAKEMRELAGLNLKSITHLEPERIDFTDQGLTIKAE